MSDKYTWDNAGDLKELSMDQTLSEGNRSDKRQFFYMVTHVFDNNNLTRDFCNRHLGSCNVLFGRWSQAHAYDPSTIWRTGLRLWLNGNTMFYEISAYLCDKQIEMLYIQCCSTSSNNQEQ